MLQLASFLLAASITLLSTSLVFAQTSIAIPKALQNEHHELFEALEGATKAGGKTGAAAQRAMSILKPHFEKEERFALPQLGALEELAKKSASVGNEFREDLAKRSDAFREQLPAMLEEHRAISVALRDMHDAALQEKQEKIANLSEMILAHAAMEEQVLYPASLLIGEYARSTSQKP